MGNWVTAVSRARCRRIMRLLEEYLNGCLDAATARKVAVHLAGCTRCEATAVIYSGIEAARLTVARARLWVVRESAS